MLLVLRLSPLFNDILREAWLILTLELLLVLLTLLILVVTV